MVNLAEQRLYYFPSAMGQVRKEDNDPTGAASAFRRAAELEKQVGAIWRRS